MVCHCSVMLVCVCKGANHSHHQAVKCQHAALGVGWPPTGPARHRQGSQITRVLVSSTPAVATVAVRMSDTLIWCIEGLQNACARNTRGCVFN